MSSKHPSSNVIGQNPQTLIQVLGIVIPALATIAGALIVMQQTKMEIQLPIYTTQTAEANQAVIAIANSDIQTSVPSATNHAVASDADSLNLILNSLAADSPSVRLIIRQDDDVIADLILPPGGTVPKINLPPGSYQVEARPIYAPITPQSANCLIQWQPSAFYKVDLLITSSETAFQIKQFDLEPQEICLTATPAPSSPTPTK